MRAFPYTVLQVVPRLDSGGAERSTLEVAAAIARAGGKALVATRGGRLAGEIEKAGGEIIEAPVDAKNPMSIWLNSFRLKKIVLARKVDLVHARSRAPGWSAFGAARAAGVPFVTTFHGRVAERGGFKRWYGSSMARGDRVIANSLFTAQAVRRTYGLSDERMRVIPRGADLDYFDPTALTEARIRRLAAAWRLPETRGGLKLLLPARLSPWKGHRLAIEALAILKSRQGSFVNEGLTLAFCGGAGDRSHISDALRASVDEYGVGDMVHWVGETSDMPAAYGWSDIVLAPSLTPEPFGRTIVEAGAMGKPVIAAGHGGALETVVDGETGAFFAPGNAGALADAIDALARAGVDGRMAMGQAAQARVRNLYSAGAMTDATLRVYRHLLEGEG